MIEEKQERRLDSEDAVVHQISTIRSYHAHIYFDGLSQRQVAEALRQDIAKRFSVLLGRWHDRLIGPHALPMYQVAFAPVEFSRLVPWLMLNRRGLTVLVHPNTGRPLADHVTNAIWIGQALQIMHLDLLPEHEGAEQEIVPNSEPTVMP